MTEVLIDHARGCLIGALAGDAAGATLEFIGHQPSEYEVTRALSMCGGGVFRVAPGQITDDGELTLAMARAISGAQTFPVDRVAAHYRAWYQSQPFDIGNATRTALSAMREKTDNGLAAAMVRCARTGNSESKANGALMRASSLGLWSVGRSLAETIEAARADACLTHPHPSCQWSSVAYVVAIRHLLLNVGDAHGAHLAAVEALQYAADQGAEEVLSWLNDARLGNLPAIYAAGRSGFVRIAFTIAFFHLLQRTNYETALRAVLSGGGDTDTNACIVGGLVGARVGLHAIPEAIWHPVRDCDTTKGRLRPKWLRARDALELAETLVTQTSSPSIQIDDSDLPKNSEHLEVKLKFSASARDVIEAGTMDVDFVKFNVTFVPPLVQIGRGEVCNYVTLRMVENIKDQTIEFPEAWYTHIMGWDEDFWMRVAEGTLSTLTGDWGGGSFRHYLVHGEWTRKGVLEFSGRAETPEDIEQICSQLRLAITTMREGLDAANS